MPIMSQGSLRAAGAHIKLTAAREISPYRWVHPVMNRPALPRPDIEPLKHSLFHRLCLSDPASMCLRARAFLSRLAVSPSHRNERTLNLGSTSLISSLEKP